MSPSKLSYYLDLVDYFFDTDDLHFRALVVPDKGLLQHALHNQNHDTWYYKMYFDMLKLLLSPLSRYRIYLDVKDTRSADKVRKLHEVLSNNMYDFNRQVVERVQSVRSHETELLQLADLLIGAVAAANRDTTKSQAKKAIIDRVRQRSGYSLKRSTLLKEEKLNIFVWRAEDVSL